MGVGVGLFLQAGFSVIQALLTPDQIPHAIGFMSLGKQSIIESRESKKLTPQRSIAWDRHFFGHCGYDIPNRSCRYCNPDSTGCG